MTIFFLVFGSLKLIIFSCDDLLSIDNKKKYIRSTYIIIIIIHHSYYDAQSTTEQYSSQKKNDIPVSSLNNNNNRTFLSLFPGSSFFSIYLFNNPNQKLLLKISFFFLNFVGDLKFFFLVSFVPFWCFKWIFSFVFFFFTIIYRIYIQIKANWVPIFFVVVFDVLFFIDMRTWSYSILKSNFRIEGFKRFGSMIFMMMMIIEPR